MTKMWRLAIERTRRNRTTTFHSSVQSVLAQGLEFLGKLVVLLFMIFPIFWMLLTAFKTPLDAYTTKVIFQPTLNNFVLIFSRPMEIGPKLLNTVIYSLITVAISVPLALMAAYVFSRYRFRGNNLLFILVLATQFIPPVVVVIPFFAVFRRLGMLDTLVALVIVNLAVTVPYAIWLLKGFVDALPTEVEEAAFVDGCTEFQVLRFVVLPLVAPGLLIVATLTFIHCWNEFMFAFLLTSRKATTLMIALNNTLGVRGIFWEQLAAGGMLVLVPIFLLSLKIRNHFVQGLTMGAVK